MTILSRVRAAMLVMLIASGGLGYVAESAAKPLTVADAIETTGFMRSTNAFRSHGSGVFVSPDGRRYVVMLTRGDLKCNCNHVELLAGGLDTLEHAEPKRIALLSTDSLGSPDPEIEVPKLTSPGSNPPMWLPDSQRVVFYWPDDRDMLQLVSVNVVTGELLYLTRAGQHVQSFDISPSGGVLYTARIEHSKDASQELLRKGFTVSGNAPLVDLLNGDVDGYGAFDRAHNVQWFWARRPGDGDRMLEGGIDPWRPFMPSAFSPDGRHVLIEHNAAAVPESWSHYTEPQFEAHVKEYRVNPAALLARYIRQMFVADLETGTIRPLWSAPAVLVTTKSAWSPDGRSVLVGPTFLPIEHADAAGLAGVAVAEVDVKTGHYRQVPIPQDATPQDSRSLFALTLRSLKWLGPDKIEVVYPSSTLQFARAAKDWKLASEVAGTSQNSPEAAPVRVEFREDDNTPPVLYAIDRAGTERMVLDPNPGLKDFTLGRVEFIDWKDKQGRAWRGRLYHPVNEPGNGKRVPLVIQTHGYAPHGEFSLYGKGSPVVGTPGLGPGISIYAAQPLANRGIAVLQIGDDEVSPLLGTPREVKAYNDGFESAVAYLVDRGLVDASRVAIAGFSRTGWPVMYALTHSSLHYAAAIVSDNSDGGYIQAAMTGWSPAASSSITGAEPFGEGLKTWLDNAPAFAIDKLNTPLRMQIESVRVGGFLQVWEVYSRARYLHKPVELYVIPNVDRGSHNLQNPEQCYASQQGAVDWFVKYLNPQATGHAEAK